MEPITTSTLDLKYVCMSNTGARYLDSVGGVCSLAVSWEESVGQRSLWEESVGPRSLQEEAAVVSFCSTSQSLALGRQDGSGPWGP